MKVSIRETSSLEEILAVQLAAFGREDEANLVENLLKDSSAKPYLSLLAFEKEKAIGHVLFTKAWLEPKTNLNIYLLAPLAIIPEFQKQGIGGQLIRHGFKILSESNVSLIFVLGHPNYYSRHGFQPAGRFGFEATYPIAEKNTDAWMVLELQPNIIGRYKGKIICADALNKPEYWIE